MNTKNVPFPCRYLFSLARDGFYDYNIAVKVLISTNPADNYKVIGKVKVSTSKEISEKVKKAKAAQLAWRELGIRGRIELLKPIRDEFGKRQEEIAQLITKEMGKPIILSREEAKKYVENFTEFMETVGNAVSDEITHEDDTSIHKIVYEPWGVAAVITPWNYPFGMAIWGVVPNLLVGNTVVLKISEECPLMGKLVEEVFLNHNLPEGVFSEVYGAGDVGEKLSKEDINFIWFTGSTRTGKALYKTAAEKLIKVVLEMGGSNPAVVFEDADIKKAANIISNSRFKNCGQICDSIKRVIVHQSVAKEFMAELKKILESKTLGDPKSEKTDFGPLVAKRQVELLKGQVKDAISKGAKVLIKINIPNNLKGAFYAPTILTNIKKNMRVWKEEVFGPVLPIITFKTEQEALNLANDTIYGLGSKVFTKDKEKAKRVASKIQSGCVDINEGNHWLNCNPFGGYKNSGIGREHGVIGFRELCQIKVISASK
ncbi:MAG: aldehyde dehydrogenase family protein [Candidatus Levybacteria bacterium]|nr:aldehyde dehydrogenase family protein [Candidatus Levybacteria bacterium]